MPRAPRRTEKEKSFKRFVRLETVCEELKLTPGTVRRYERRGLVRIEWIQTSDGKERAVFPPREVKRLRRIRLLTRHLHVNLAGVEVILRLLDRIEE